MSFDELLFVESSSSLCFLCAVFSSSSLFLSFFFFFILLDDDDDFLSFHLLIDCFVVSDSLNGVEADILN